MDAPNGDPQVFPDVQIPGYDAAKAASIDFEERGRELMLATKRRDAIACYEASCPAEYKEFDPFHPNAIKNKQAVDAVMAWQFGPVGLLVAGETGRCKTRSVRALTKRLAYRDGIMVRSYHAQDFFSSLAAEVRYGRDDAAAWIDRKAWHPIVYIDDWGQEAVLANKEDWAQGWWLRFIDLRLERRLPVIITTNLGADDVKQNQNSSIRADPLLRRLREICTVVKFT